MIWDTPTPILHTRQDEMYGNCESTFSHRVKHWQSQGEICTSVSEKLCHLVLCGSWDSVEAAQLIQGLNQISILRVDHANSHSCHSKVLYVYTTTFECNEAMPRIRGNAFPTVEVVTYLTDSPHHVGSLGIWQPVKKCVKISTSNIFHMYLGLDNMAKMYTMIYFFILVDTIYFRYLNKQYFKKPQKNCQKTPTMDVCTDKLLKKWLG